MTKSKDSFNYFPYYLIACVIGIFGIFAPFIFTRSWGGISFGTPEGVIGDTIGGITAPFFNLLGSILVYVALRAQIDANKQINDQFIKQEKDNTRRDFENTFFQMLQIHHQIVDTMDLELGELMQEVIKDLRTQGYIGDWDSSKVPKDLTVTSRDVFKRTYNFFNELLNRAFVMKKLRQEAYEAALKKTNTNATVTPPQITLKNDNEILEMVYIAIYKKLDSDLGHYFRNLYRIIKIIEEQDFKEEEKWKVAKLKYDYASIVRAQLSDYEVYLLFYNGLIFGKEKFKPLMEKYTLLKILAHRKEDLLLKFKGEYEPSAFLKI